MALWTQVRRVLGQVGQTLTSPASGQTALRALLRLSKGIPWVGKDPALAFVWSPQGFPTPLGMNVATALTSLTLADPLVLDTTSVSTSTLR